MFKRSGILVMLIMTGFFLLGCGGLMPEQVEAVQVQVGAFQQKENVKNRASLLKNLGYKPLLQTNAQGLTRVRTHSLSDSRYRTLKRTLNRKEVQFITIGKEPAPDRSIQRIRPEILEKLPPLRDSHHTVELSREVSRRLDKAMGTDYVWGGESFEEGGFDCSGLLVWLFRYNDMPRTSTRMWKWTKRIKREQLQTGDFVFFNFESTGEPDHVGLYLGNNKFVHASSSYGVIKARFQKEYYQRHLFGLGRPPGN
ncbi:MAG: NlpC/P60 family protein [bacterium]